MTRSNDDHTFDADTACIAADSNNYCVRKFYLNGDKFRSTSIGYFLDDPVYENVVVLSIVSFEPNFSIDFQSVVQTLISDAKAAGKTKLVVDFSFTGGGINMTGHDTFRQSFPQNAHAFNVLSKYVSTISANFKDQINAYKSILNYDII